MRAAALALALIGSLGGQALAETLVAATSTNVVEISSNFSGTDIAVFGMIERDRATVSRAEPYKVAVQLFGPKETVMTRRKERRAGIWVNATSRVHADVPSFYVVLTTDPIADIATPETLKRFQVGLANLLLPQKIVGGIDVEGGNPEFREAFIRLKSQAGLYREVANKVEFLTPSLFRATIPIPANVPIGRYRVQIVLFQEGLSLAEHSSDLVISKTGFEQLIYDLAFSASLVYGLGTVILALVIGWIGSVVFRRD
jgi:uncharacterized protein (TIGR02186 family)